MAQGIEYAGKELLHRNGHGVGWVKKRKVRLSAPNRTLDFLFLVGDDRFAVHLAAGAEQCNDGAEWDKLIWKGILRIFQLPNILVQLGLRGNNLAAVGYRAAAHGKNQVNLMFPCQLCTLQRLGVGWVRHDSGKLYHALARCLQDSHHFIVYAVALDGAAAIRQHNSITIISQHGFEMCTHAPLAEINLRLVLIDKIVHLTASFPFGFRNRIALSDSEASVCLALYFTTKLAACTPFLLQRQTDCRVSGFLILCTA